MWSLRKTLSRIILILILTLTRWGKCFISLTGLRDQNTKNLSNFAQGGKDVKFCSWDLGPSVFRLQSRSLVTELSCLKPPDVSGYSEPVLCPSSSAQALWGEITSGGLKKPLQSPHCLVGALGQFFAAITAAICCSCSNIKLSEARTCPKSHAISESDPHLTRMIWAWSELLLPPRSLTLIDKLCS